MIRYRRLPVADIVEETPDACSLVLAVPPELAAEFAYRPGQYLTIRVPGAAGGAVARCYSLSSSPHTDDHLKITVKRVPDGRASNWICDHVKAGAVLELLPPSGAFTPGSLDGDLLLLAGGSGITPVMSIIKSALALGSGHLTLVYANRDPASVIFAAELRALEERHPSRLRVAHWFDNAQGPPDAGKLAPLLASYADRDAYVCGPEPFVAVACKALGQLGVPEARVHIERFHSALTPATAETDDPAPEASDASEAVPALNGAAAATAEVHLDGQVHRLPWAANTRLLDVLISAGLNPPYSCRQGTCGACACRVVEGEVELVHNEILEDEDFAEGYTLACQAIPRTATVRVTYS
jgi:3-ketosteroid 9alpha-monooxygenase subunit B